MSKVRWAVAAVLVGTTFAALPASAQFYMKPRDLTGTPVLGDEPGIAQPMPGATAAERRASLVWNMRAALNVAALQCQFEPTLITVPNYNAILTDHKDELKTSFDTLTKYFTRTAKTKAAGQQALDQFGTRTYSSYSTVTSQFGFCQTAAAIGRDAVFQPRGRFGDIAEQRMRELRNSLTPWGEQALTRNAGSVSAMLPRFDAVCWSRKGEWQTRKCGAQGWPPAGAGMASR